MAMRLAIVDHQFLAPTTLPSHDMYQGAAYFATNMHALRLEGDLAWWNPISDFGYAQYYQCFLSPLAPTCGHVVFILWALTARALALLGVGLPEYMQYVAVTYVAMPWLAYAAFLAFCSLIFASRAAIVLAGIVYAFSGIGLWHSAWFYFQEPFTLYLLLGSVVAALQRPVPSRLLLVLVAVLVQVAALNYWTVYDSWFVVLVLGAYAGFHGNQVRRLARRLVTLWRTRRAGMAAALTATALTAAVWLGMLATIVQEQGPAYMRTERAADAGAYGPEDASGRIHELRSFTTDFFHAGFTDAMTTYARDNPIHNARYLGAELVPLLAAFAAAGWGRRDRWLVACAAAVLCICLGPPLLLQAWAEMPGLSNIVHFFYFYSHHLQVLVALLAAAGLDIVLVRYPAKRRRALRLAVAATAVVAVLVLVELGVFATLFPSKDVRLQAGIAFALGSLVVAVPLLRQLAWPSGTNRRLLVGILLAVLSADLTRYFWLVARADIAFTAQHRFLRDVEQPFSPALQATLRRRWADPDPAQGFGGGVAANMPIASSVWPVNYYIVSRRLMELGQAAGRSPSPGADLGFFPDAQVRTARGDAGEVVAPHDGLLVTADGGLPPARPASPTGGSGSFRYLLRSWRYNGFRFDLEAPSDGWVVITQLFDPTWQIEVDGRPVTARRADHILMAVPVDAGTRTLEMEYRPRARRIYWPASALLLITCAALLISSRSASASRGRRAR
jgi:hypothetical protein